MAVWPMIPEKMSPRDRTGEHFTEDTPPRHCVAILVREASCKLRNEMKGEPMSRMPQSPMQPKNAVVMRPKKIRKRFRWSLIAVPAAIVMCLWLASGINVGFAWVDVENALHVHNRTRYTQLACLGLVAVAIVAVARILRKDSQGEGK